jgi:UDP-N-acetylglucosamine acyltransferase
MPQIHSTAIIEDGAQLADDVTVGAFSYIGPQVTIDAGTRVGRNCQIINKVTIGKNNDLHFSVALGDLPQEHQFDNVNGELIIGDGNIFREFFNAHLPAKKPKTIIGNNGFFMANSHVAHDCEVSDNVIMVNYAGIAGHAIIGKGVLISGLAMVHQFCRVGEYSVVGGSSKLAGDLPPYFLANGSPARVYGLNKVGLKRNGFSAAARKRLSEIFHVLYNEGLPIPKAIKLINERYAEQSEEGEILEVTKNLISFLNEKGRPIARGSRSESPSED